MTDSVFSALPIQTQIALARLSDAVEDVQPISVNAWPIEVAALPSLAAASSLLRDVSEWAGAGNAFLYYFECGSASIDLAKVQSTFTRAKARKAHERAYPRLNVQGTCFYVGSSRSLVKRLEEHLGFGARGTYALQLTHWAAPLSLRLHFVCARYADETPREVIQALEDTLWMAMRPMFGRRGAK